VFCGTEAYTGIRQLADSPGMDGTVLWAGASLNTRKIVLDLTRAAAKHPSVEKWMGTNVPVHLMAGMNQGTIIAEPTNELVALVKRRCWSTIRKIFARG
jgi:hypothetical protein